MAKIYGKCKLCGASKFLNGMGLCKRCNKKEESLAIREKSFEKRKERIASSKEDHKRQEEAAAEAAKEEATAETTKEAKEEDSKKE